jgi:hypothetical protein
MAATYPPKLDFYPHNRKASSMKKRADDAAETVAYAVLLTPFFLIGLVPVLLWFGWSVSVLWGWFVVPAFGIPAISVSQGAGLSLFARRDARQAVCTEGRHPPWHDGHNHRPWPAVRSRHGLDHQVGGAVSYVPTQFDKWQEGQAA